MQGRNDFAKLGLKGLLVLLAALFTATFMTWHDVPSGWAALESPDNGFIWQAFGLQERKAPVLRYYGGSLYAGTDNGLYRRRMIGTVVDADWAHVGLSGTRISDIYVRPGSTGSHIVYALLADSPNNRSLAWSTAPALEGWSYDDGSLPVGFSNATEAIVGKTDDEKMLFVTGYTDYDGNMRVFRSQDTGASWESVLETGFGLGLHDIATSAISPTILWTGGESGALAPMLYKSVDGGDTWNLLPAPFQGGDNAVNAILVSATQPDTVFLGIEGYILKTTDGGETWRTVFQSLSGPYFFSLDQDPADPDHLVAAGSLNTGPPGLHIEIYQSHDGGETWLELPFLTALERGMREQVVFGDGSTIYLGTDQGVYRLTAPYRVFMPVILK